MHNKILDISGALHNVSVVFHISLTYADEIHTTELVLH